jgi:hypothetical protein
VSTTTRERPMAKRNDITAKVDAEALRVARIVAAYRGLTLAEYLSDIVLATATRDREAEERKERDREAGKSKR